MQGAVGPVDRLFEAPRGEMSDGDSNGVERGMRIEWADRALHDQPRLVTAIRAKIVANAHLGRLDEARADLARMLALYPGLTIGTFRTSAASFDSEFVERYITGLRLAGLPEG